MRSLLKYFNNKGVKLDACVNPLGYLARKMQAEMRSEAIDAAVQRSRVSFVCPVCGKTDCDFFLRMLVS